MCNKVIDECPFGGFVIDAKFVLIGIEMQFLQHDVDRFQQLLLPHVKEHYGRYYMVVHFLQKLGNFDITDEMYDKIKYDGKIQTYNNLKIDCIFRTDLAAEMSLGFVRMFGRVVRSGPFFWCNDFEEIKLEILPFSHRCPCRVFET
eukprot:UN02290